MRISNFQYPAFEPYKKATLEVYMQGCLRDTCTGPCHNPALRDMCGGEEWTIDEVFNWIEERKDLFDCISFTGGDPLFQESELKKLVEKLIFKCLWLFTGEDDWDKIPQWCKEKFDYIKYGGYKTELRQEGFPASSNQKLVKITRE